MKNKFVLFIIFIACAIFCNEEALAGGCAPAVTNPSCATAIPLVVNDPCVNGSTCQGGASTASTCVSGAQASWFSFVATNATQDITLTFINSGGCHMRSAVYSSTGACAGLTEIGCQSGAPLDDIYNFTTLTPGNTYYVQLSYNPGGTCGNGGAVDVCIQVTGPAVANCTDNDDCLSPAAFPVNAAGSGAACINDCNTGATNGPNFSGNGSNCFDLPNPTVWYSFTTDASITNLDINLSSATDLSDPEFTLFTTADCINFTIVDCVEGASGSASSTSIAVTPSTTYILAISDASGDVGFFDLCITQNGNGPAGCTDNQECGTAATIPLNPPSGGQSCVADCNTGATPGPDDVGNNCYDFPNETVWYSFTTNSLTATLDINLTSTDLSSPVFTLWSNNCPLTTYFGSACAVSSVTGLAVQPSTTYLLAVSDANGDQGNFNLCIEQFEDLSACNTNDVLSVTSTSLNSPITGPFQPGEVVNFCYTINGWVTQSTNCNYLQAIIPTFGPCWDPASFSPDGEPSITTALTTQGVIVGGANDGLSAGTWDWFPSGSVAYNLPGPSNTGLVAGDDIGAGWFFTTSYQGHNGDPDASYGDHDIAGNAGSASASCADASSVWQVCFDLTATSTCVDGMDCSVSIKTYADGEIGIWSDIGCTADLPTTQFSNLTCVLLTNYLEEFRGHQLYGDNHLTWAVTEQSVIDMFEIERSYDGINWVNIQDVQFETGKVVYSFIDNSPLSTISYYRLTLKGINGDVAKSRIIAIKSPNDGSGLISEISPNPVKEQINFVYTGGNINNNISVTISNMIGQILIDKVITINNNNQECAISTSDLSDGVYYVRVTQGQYQIVKKITVDR